MFPVALALIFAVAAVAWPVMPPPLVPQPVVDHYPGDRTIVDPYRQLEDLKAPAVQAYFKTQATYTNDVLAQLGPGRDKLRADIGRLVDAGTVVSTLTLGRRERCAAYGARR